jgi:formylglycine-generating enzyme required for sulfatase activity
MDMKLMSSRKSAALHKRFRRAMAFAAFAALATDVYAASIKIESVAQRWPWNNKLDITYLVEGGQAGSAYARIVFTATIAGKAYTFSSGDVGASAVDGKRTATWTIPSGLRAAGCTVKADLVASDVPSGNDYMIVDLASGKISYEGVFVGQKDSDRRYNTDEYKTRKLVLRKVPAGGPYPTGIGTNEGGKWGSNAYPSGSMASSPKNWTTDRDYYIGIFELTQSQYEKICGATTFSENKGDKKPANGKDNKNVTYFALRGDRTIPTEKIPSVSSDTGTFFQRLNFKTGLYFDLPTDVMWEIAARAGTTTVYSWGDDSITDKFEDYVVLNSIKDVGTKLPNNWGIYDTTGNADEICRDDNSQLDMANAASPFIAAWAGGWFDWNTGRYRMSRRGGACGSSSDEIKQRMTSYRHIIKPDAGFGSTGFRVSYVAE